MNIIEAVKSGLPFKRPSDNKYFYLETATSPEVRGCVIYLTREGVLANDWEVLEVVNSGWQHLDSRWVYKP